MELQDLMELKALQEKYQCAEFLLDAFLEAPRKVQQLLLMDDPMKARIFLGERIKSPIEQIFITAFEIYCKNKKEIYLFSQKKINVNGKKYYIDFEFDCNDYLTNMIFKDEIKNKNYKLAIECDGYEFHKKTKEQVQKDNEREFDLKMAGYDILRFSGTQIYNNPMKCAKDTYDYIIKKIQEE